MTPTLWLRLYASLHILYWTCTEIKQMRNFYLRRGRIQVFSLVSSSYFRNPEDHFPLFWPPVCQHKTKPSVLYYLQYFNINTVTEPEWQRLPHDRTAYRNVGSYNSSYTMFAYLHFDSRFVTYLSLKGNIFIYGNCVTCISFFFYTDIILMTCPLPRNWKMKSLDFVILMKHLLYSTCFGINTYIEI